MKTKISLFTIIISFVVLQNSFSQVSSEWVSRYDFDSDGAEALVVDNSGNVYVTGESDEDYVTIKYNSFGDTLWVRRYDGPGNSTDLAHAIAVDGSGNVYLTGSSTGVSSDLDYATIKYNSSGVQQWAVRYNGPGNNVDEAFSIAIDGSGNVYVTGNSFGSASVEDYATIKYNSSGVLQWVTRFNGIANDEDFAFRLVLDGLSNVYVTGSSRSSSFHFDYATVKYNSSGVEQWVRTYNGPGGAFDEATSIAVDGLSNIYVTGASFGAGTSFDYATIKYNSSGDSLWVKRYNGTGNGEDDANSIAVDITGNVYVTGMSYSGSPNNNDFATVKYNSSGVLQWDKRYNGLLVNDRDDVARSMTLDNLGNVYVSGSSEGTNSDYDYAVVKYNGAGVEQWVQRYVGVDVGFTDDPFSIAVDAAYNVYVTGRSTGNDKTDDYATLKYSQTGSSLTLNLTSFIEGFYNSVSNNMISDTGRVFLRNIGSPYAIVDSSKATLNSSGVGTFYFSNISNGINYYIVLKHRNSIETWSSSGQAFSSGVLAYDFTTAANKAYGNNMNQVDASPVRFAIYSGDVNQDGVVDGTDLSLIDNDASNFLSGYIVTDVNGDNFIDGSDAVITGNNSDNFVSLIRP